MPVFVLDPRLLHGGRFPSANRAWFLLESLRELRAALRERGGELFVRAGRPEAVLPALARETRRRARSTSPPTCRRSRWPATARVETALGEAARPAGSRATSSRTSARRARRTAARSAVFSPFWRALGELPRRSVHGAPRALSVPAGLARRARSRAPAPEARRAVRRRARRGARAAAPLARRTASTRYSRAPRPAGGRDLRALALPALRLRLGARGRAARARAGRSGRRGVRAPARVARLLRARAPAPPGQRARTPTSRATRRSSGPTMRTASTPGATGRTGFPVVDAGMRQLRTTGWMHNRARLIVGSLPHQGPAPRLARAARRTSCATCCAATRRRTTATGSGSRRSASIRAPYFRRMYNPVAQQLRHDPDGAYVRRWCPSCARCRSSEARRAVDDERRPSRRRPAA